MKATPPKMSKRLSFIENSEVPQKGVKTANNPKRYAAPAQDFVFLFFFRPHPTQHSLNNIHHSEVASKVLIYPIDTPVPNWYILTNPSHRRYTTLFSAVSPRTASTKENTATDRSRSIESTLTSKRRQANLISPFCALPHWNIFLFFEPAPTALKCSERPSPDSVLRQDVSFATTLHTTVPMQPAVSSVPALSPIQTNPTS